MWHTATCRIIVEKDAGSGRDGRASPQCRQTALPVWFVAFGGARPGDKTAQAAGKYRNMGVTYSTKGEYANATDVLVPVKSA